MAGVFPALRSFFFGAPVERTGMRVNWPTGPYPGSGDMGAPGEWQMRGRNVSDDLLMAFGAVYASVQIISGDAAKLPVLFYDIAPDGTKTLNTTYPTNALMRKPNSYQNRMQFMQAVVLSYLTTGNVYIYKVYDARQMVKAMHVLDPRAVWPYIAQSGAVYYRCAPNLLAGIIESVALPARYMGHIRLQFSAAYPLVGVSPIYAAAASSATGQRILYNTQKFFGNGSRPGGVLTFPGKVADTDAARTQTSWDANYSGSGQGKTAVLSEGATFTPLTMTATDAQLIEQLKWSVEDVARVFRVPPFMIGDQSKTTYRNSEQLSRTYLNGCLQFHLEGMVSEFNSMFEFDASMTTAFDLDFLLKTEIDVRYDANGKALQAGWKTINEVRRSEGLPIIEYGDDPLVQAQMRTLESIVEGTADPAAPATPADPNAPVDPAEPPEPPEPAEPPETEDPVTNAFPYRGVWDHGDHKAGDAVTHAGAMWFARRATSQRPGDPANTVQDWQLAVKSGANGKTPVFKITDKGLVETSTDGKTWTNIGDLRPLFQEIVANALKGAGI